jgi:hypothetical protein
LSETPQSLCSCVVLQCEDYNKASTFHGLSINFICMTIDTLLSYKISSHLIRSGVRPGGVKHAVWGCMTSAPDTVRVVRLSSSRVAVCITGKGGYRNVGY